MSSGNTSVTESGRPILLLVVIVGSLAAALPIPPVFQDQAYHAFADQHALFDIPRFSDIVTNLPFLVIGIAGLQICLNGRVKESRRSWMVFFAGVALVGIGSAYYYADPDDLRLVWDRLPMTIGFMAVLVAVLSERVHERIETFLLPPAVLAGMASVLWWSVTGDLRLYIWIQALPLIMIPMVLLVYPGRPGGDRFIIVSFLCYVLAKAAEHYDTYLYEVTRHIISGHSLKHLAAAAGCAVILVLLRKRKQVAVEKKNDCGKDNGKEMYCWYDRNGRR
jgi:hypothetical protein